VTDDLEIVVLAWDDDGSDYCGTISGAEVQHAHDEDDTPFFAIDCCPGRPRACAGRRPSPQPPPGHLRADAPQLCGDAVDLRAHGAAQPWGLEVAQVGALQVRERAVGQLAQVVGDRHWNVVPAIICPTCTTVASGVTLARPSTWYSAPLP